MKQSILALVFILALTGCSSWLPLGPERDQAIEREEKVAGVVEDAVEVVTVVAPALPPPWNYALLGLGALAAGAAAAWRESVGRHKGWEEKEQDLAKAPSTETPTP